MPTYQYACTECGHQLEAVQSFTDEPLTECPACEGRLRKLFNSVGIVFKGSGFYRTDSRSNGSDSSTTAKPETTKSASGSSGSADTGSSTSSGTSGSANGSGSGSGSGTTSGGSGSGNKSTTASASSAA
ncbi:FmdB family zinc ribbon protein [Plantactinospora sonchi]|uniref:FmdB family zinc ribbon protein n=1 Tax=Plantactinospora sonchi TaxID=1544735 RepID=A0ABU7RSK7_9ACTN